MWRVIFAVLLISLTSGQVCDEEFGDGEDSDVPVLSLLQHHAKKYQLPDSSEGILMHTDPVLTETKPIRAPPNSALDAYEAEIGFINDDDKIDYHNLVFTNVKVNNLGGQGPDVDGPPVMRFGRVAEVKVNNHDVAVDLIVSVDEAYQAAHPQKNGLHGALGNINLEHSTECEFTFQFVNAKTDEPIRIGQFFFSILDMDTGKGFRRAESLTIDGFKDYYIIPQDNNGEVLVSDLGDGVSSFQGTAHGTEQDNPEDAFVLTEQQARRTVTFRFLAGLNEFKWKYSTAKRNMNVLFGGMSMLYFCKTEKLDIDMSLARVLYSNLGGNGPDFDRSEGILYSDVASTTAGKIDLLVTVEGEYQSENASLNGLNGSLGRIQMKPGTENRFHFNLLHHGSNENYLANWMYFSFYDLDEGKANVASKENSKHRHCQYEFCW